MDFSRLAAKLLLHCINVGKFFGIAVRIHWSFWVLPLAFALVGLQFGLINAAVMALFILVFFAQAVVPHEYGHILTARRFGIKTRDIILTPLGGIARMENMPENPVAELLIAVAGPAVNIAACVILIPICSFLPGEFSKANLEQFHLAHWKEFVVLLAGANAFMAAFNMLPAFPSDGGRVLRALLTVIVGRLPATQIAVGLGAVVAVGLAVYGVIRGAVQLPFIAVLFAFLGQMELWMLKRQEELRGRPYAQSADLSPERAALYQAPEPNFSGYTWDEPSAAWIEWREGIAVRKCRMRVG